MARIQGDLRQRTFRFAASILELVDALPNNVKGWEIGKQLVRSGCGIGSKVREADNAISNADFALKCSHARKEASETNYWLELSHQAGLLVSENVIAAIQEADELTRILSTVVKNTQEHLARGGCP